MVSFKYLHSRGRDRAGTGTYNSAVAFTGCFFSPFFIGYISGCDGLPLSIPFNFWFPRLTVWLFFFFQLLVMLLDFLVFSYCLCLFKLNIRSNLLLKVKIKKIKLYHLELCLVVTSRGQFLRPLFPEIKIGVLGIQHLSEHHLGQGQHKQVGEGLRHQVCLVRLLSGAKWIKKNMRRRRRRRRHAQWLRWSNVTKNI